MLFNSAPIEVVPDFWLLPAFVDTGPLRFEIENIARQAAFRNMQVPSTRGDKIFMKVAMTNCGEVGWTSSDKGYCYLASDPQLKPSMPWPPMPNTFKKLATQACATIGWAPFEPDACLINRYENSAGMGLHQDKDEADLTQPIVSVSIGASCKFIVGGFSRKAPTQSIALNDGDVLVWGKTARLIYHGVRPIQANQTRYNLTFRKAL
jgi:DNA oxidative demethylase